MSSRKKPTAGKQPHGIVSHREFLESIGEADFEAYSADPRARVTSLQAFEQMRGHVQHLYDGVKVAHSFVDTTGQVFDCVPIEQQPSLRGGSARLPKAPDLPALRPPGHKAAATSNVEPAVPPLHPDRKDRHGNAMHCPKGTIPIRRVTLDELVRFQTTGHFFRKSPIGGRSPGNRPSVPDTSNSANNHRYAYANETVDNLGAHNFLNVWSPAVDSNQVFSLAQHWYAGGSGANHQTVEVGWQVFPTKYNTSSPCLFIYWTADNYGSSGAYNLDKTGFVQLNPAWPIGGSLSPVSASGGAQLEIEIAAYLYNGNWWLYLGGTAAANAIGYYPTSLFNGGQMATAANEFLCGGETVCTAVSWPPMGSGAMASTGWQQAAYQRDIFHFPTSGGAAAASLTAQAPSPACYTIDLESDAAPWNNYFFYGGPGGTNC